MSSGVKISDFDNYPLKVDVQIINHGQTPAYDLRHQSWFMPMPLPAGRTHPPQVEDAMRSNNVTLNSKFPNAPVAKGEMAFASNSPNLGVAVDQLDARKHHLFKITQTGETIVHIFGRVGYRDVYGDEHVSDYHVYIGDDVGIQYRMIDNERIVAVAYWHTGNDAD